MDFTSQGLRAFRVRVMVAALLAGAGACADVSDELAPGVDGAAGMGGDDTAVASAELSASCVSNADCDDANVCTTDKCVRVSKSLSRCTHSLKVNLACNDGNTCTSNDRCRASDGACHGDALRNGTLCDDGNICTASTTCTSGSCGGGTSLSCNDDNACTAESCDPATGCKHTPIVCAPSDACHTATCDPATGCKQAPVSCDDGNPCTMEICLVIAGGRCAYGRVADGTACTLAGVSGTCTAGVCSAAQ